MESDSVKIDLTFSDEDAADVVALLDETGASGVKHVEQRGMTGVEMVVVGVVLVNAIAGLIAKLSRLWKCGVIINAAGATLVTEKNCDLPRGSVVIVKRDGTEVTLDRPSDADLSSLLKELLPART